jgi:hypothetical protein
MIETMRARRCYLCHRDISDGLYVRVSWPDGHVRDVCDVCYARADDDSPLDETLDMSEGDDE